MLHRRVAEKLAAILVPFHRVQFVADQLVVAGERRLLAMVLQRRHGDVIDAQRHRCGQQICVNVCDGRMERWREERKWEYG